MRQIRQGLRLHLEADLSHSQTGGALGIPKATVGKYARLARAARVNWSVAQGLSDEDLEGRSYPPAVRGAHHLEPDYALIHQELKRPGVTLQLLWKEPASHWDESLASSRQAVAAVEAQMHTQQQESARLLSDSEAEVRRLRKAFARPSTKPWPARKRCARNRPWNLPPSSTPRTKPMNVTSPTNAAFSRTSIASA